MLVRTERGQARLLEAYCPHLGAHLGHGGKVEGELLACPFHGWRFQGDGRLAEVPYSQHAPPRLCQRAWPVCEYAGQLLAWHHPDGAPPDWTPPPLPEIGSPDWTPLRAVRRWPVSRATVQQVAEQGMARLAFGALDRAQVEVVEARTEGLLHEGPQLTRRTWLRLRLLGAARLLAAHVEGPLDVHLHGPGICVYQVALHARRELRCTLVCFLVPGPDEAVEVAAFLTVRRAGGGLGTALLWRQVAAALGTECPVPDVQGAEDAAARRDGVAPGRSLHGGGEVLHRERTDARQDGAEEA